MTADLYETLGVASDATEAEIGAAFRQAAKRAHPDAGGDADRFGALATAHKVLRDPKRRARYDATGEVEDGPDMTRTKALELINRALDRCLALDQSGRLDFVERIRREIKTELDELREHQKSGAAMRDRFEALGNRFVAEGPVNHFAGMIAEKTRTIDQASAAAAGEIELREAALAILTGYRFIVEPPRQAPTASFSFSNLTTTTAGP